MIISSVLIHTVAGKNAYRHIISIRMEETSEATKGLLCSLEKMQIEPTVLNREAMKLQKSQKKTYAEVLRTQESEK